MEDPPILEAKAEPVLNPSGNIYDQVALTLAQGIANSNRIHAQGTAEVKAMAAKGIEMAGKGIAMAAEGIEKEEKADAKAEKVQEEVQELKTEVRESAVKAVQSTKKEANARSKALTGTKLFLDVPSDSSQASSPASSKDTTPTSLASSSSTEEDITASYVGSPGSSPQAVDQTKFAFDNVHHHHQLAPLKEEDEDDETKVAPNVGMVKKLKQMFLSK